MTGHQIAQQMAPQGVRIDAGGFRDFYEPEIRTVHLSRVTGDGKSLDDIVTASHECGHAVIDVLDGPMWRLWKFLAGATFNCLIFGIVALAVLAGWHPWEVAIAGSLVLVSRVFVVLAIEREVSRIALAWLDLNGHLQPGMRERLSEMSRTYWLSTLR